MIKSTEIKVIDIYTIELIKTRLSTMVLIKDILIAKNVLVGEDELVRAFDKIKTTNDIIDFCLVLLSVTQQR